MWSTLCGTCVYNNGAVCTCEDAQDYMEPVKGYYTGCDCYEEKEVDEC